MRGKVTADAYSGRRCVWGELTMHDDDWEVTRLASLQPETRIIEHKHFEFGTQPKTVISREYSSEWTEGSEPFYPVNDQRNGDLYSQYKKLVDQQSDVIFGGRLAEYKYYDMDKVIESALAANL